MSKDANRYGFEPDRDEVAIFALKIVFSCNYTYIGSQ